MSDSSRRSGLIVVAGLLIGGAVFFVIARIGQDEVSKAEVCQNTCPDYSTSWVQSCPAGERCLTFTNASAAETVHLAYQVGCDSDGRPGAPQCDCTNGPVLAPGASAYWLIVDGNYVSCPAETDAWTPSCLTGGLAVLANTGAATCASGTRVEFTAGNEANPFGRADFYNIDVEKDFYSIAVAMAPDITCAVDHEGHDCRPLWCDNASCPDAYSTPASGGCPDDRSPQVGCQDTFNSAKGVTTTFFPASGKSCQSATPCPP